MAVNSLKGKKKTCRGMLVLVSAVVACATLAATENGSLLAEDAGFTTVRPRSSPAPQVGATVDRLPAAIEELADSILRVELYRNGSWEPRGTAFLVATNGRRAVAATSAHVVEVENDALPFFLPVVTESSADDDEPTTETAKTPRRFRVTLPRRGEKYELAVEPLVHPQRKESGDNGPDVALLQFDLPIGAPALKPIELIASDFQAPLRGRTVYVLGFPGLHYKYNDVFITRGTISVTDAGREWISYDNSAGPGASGGPLVLFDSTDPHSRPQVIGIQTCCTFIGRIFSACHARRLHELLAQVGAKLPGRARVDAPFRQIAGNQTEPNRGPIIRGQSADSEDDENKLPAFEVEVGHSEAESRMQAIRELARRGNLKEARHAVVDLVGELEQQTLPVPTELRLLQAKLLIGFGKSLPQDGQRQVTRNVGRGKVINVVVSAKDEYRTAEATLKKVIQAEPQNSEARVLYLRATANEAAPTFTNPLDQTTMQWVHDQAKRLLKEHPLTQQQRAQVCYVLGFTHSYLPCGTDRGKANFIESFKLYPSRQADETILGLDGWLISGSQYPDLWEPASTVKRQPINDPGIQSRR